MLTNKEIHAKLLKDNYIVYFNKKLVVTNKFYREFDSKELLTKLKSEVTQREKNFEAQVSLPVPAYHVPQAQNFKQFILDCDIPKKLDLNSGGLSTFYYVNRYSEPANKAFNKMIIKGIRYDVLVAATKLYYKSGGPRQAIGNYITEGTWESFYDEMVDSLENGTAEIYINKSLKGGGFSRYD